MSAPRPNQRVGRFDEMPADEAKALLEAMDSMSAPRKIWAYDDGLNSPDSRTWSTTVPVGPSYHHDDVVRELVEALEFYADRKFTGYEVDISDYGLSMSKGEIVLDEGDIARAALAKIAQDA